MGVLKIQGTIDVSQYWPENNSDADTTKMIIDVKTDSFKFKEGIGKPYKVTKVFNNAKVIGSSGAKPCVDNKGRLTIRLQGIDAPELHYRPVKPPKMPATDAQKNKFKNYNEEYRQFLAETATVALRDFAGKKGKLKTVKCVVYTQVDEPNDVFDTYGRLVGEAHIYDGNKDININHWLCQNGWAFPGLYASMSKYEINAFISSAKKGRSKNFSVWKYFEDKINYFDEKIVYRKPKTNSKPNIEANKDKGPILFPKLFRRKSVWWALNKSGIYKGNFTSYLKSLRDSDAFYETKDFLAQGTNAATLRYFDENIKNGKFGLDPEDLVFREKKSTLKTASGKNITKW